MCAQRMVFSTANNNTDIEAKKEAFLAKERAHFESLPDKDKKYYQAFRLALIKRVEESWADEKNWWNRISNMSTEEMEVLPNEYVRKFGSFIIKTEEIQKIAQEEWNKDLPQYAGVQTLDSLKTNEDLAHDEEEKQRALRADLSYQYQLEGYMKRQPRLDLKKDVGNYNYEQFREYTSLYESAKKKDDEELK